MDQADYILRARQLCQVVGTENPKALTDTEVISAIESAVDYYSRQRPRHLPVDITGNGTANYNTTLLSGYSEDRHRIEKIEFPIDKAPPVFLQQGAEWQMYRTTVGLFFQLSGSEGTAIKPSTSQTIRVQYTGDHAITTASASTTVSNSDFNGLSFLVAANCCDMLAAQQLRQKPAGTGVDFALDNKDVGYGDLADRYRQRYDAEINAGPLPGSEDVGAKGGTLVVYSNTGTRDARGDHYIYHDSRDR